MSGVFCGFLAVFVLELLVACGPTYIICRALGLRVEALGLYEASVWVRARFSEDAWKCSDLMMQRVIVIIPIPQTSALGCCFRD